MAEVSQENDLLLTAKTPLMQIPQAALAPLGRKLGLSELTLGRLLQATISRMNAAKGTVLDRPATKGFW